MGDRVLLLGGAHVQALSVARSLGKAGFEVHLAAPHWTSYGWSRYVERSHRHPDPVIRRNAFVSWVDEMCDRQGIELAIPIDDSTTLSLTEAAEGGGLRATLVAPPVDVVRTALDKRAMAIAAEAAGVMTPASTVVTDARDASRLAHAWGGEAVVKSAIALAWRGDRDSIQGGRVMRCSTPEATEMAAAELVGLEGRALVQELVHGQEYGVGAVRGAAGELPSVQQVRVRSWPPTGGAPALVRSVPPVSEIAAAARRVLDQLDWRGVAQLDVIAGPDGPVLLDVNGRVWFSVGLAIAAGVDIPTLAVAVARGEPIPSTVEYDSDVGWLWADSEVRYLACLLGNRRNVRTPGEGLGSALRRWRRDTRAPTVVAPIERGDPLPALGALGIELPRTLLRNRLRRMR